MNAEQYFQVCEACDHILEATDSTLERVAIPWLHVLNEHPANLVRYAGLVDSGRPVFIQGVKRTLRTLWDMRPRFSREAFWHGSDALPDRADVVIISHLLNESQAGASEDFYFGQLPEALEKRGLTTVVALRDHTGLNPQRLARCLPSTGASRVLFSETIGWLGEVGLRRRLSREAAALRRAGNKVESGLQKRVWEAAATQAMTPSSVASLRLYIQVQTLVERLRPKSIVVTYEGHAWERIVFAAARSVNPLIRCVGYHHAILFPRQHAIKRALRGKYDPDMICTAGNVTRSILESACRLHGIPVVTVGTHRQEEPKGSLMDKESMGLTPACLVIPDGTLEECLTIFSFVLEAAMIAPTINFIFRLHPVMPLASVMERYARLRNPPSNVHISDQSIDADFKRSRWAIYRGSGAAIRAVVAGLRPFYFKPHWERLGIDPLYDLDAWRCVISSPEELLARIELDLTSDVGILIQELAKPKEFCMEYFIPVDINKFCQNIVNPEHES